MKCVHIKGRTREDMSMTESRLADGVERQFLAAFDVLEAAIRTFTQNEWTTGGPPFDGPARAVAHALQCAEFYTNHDKTVRYRLGKAVWQMDASELPSPAMMLDYLQQVKRETLAWVGRLSAEGFSETVDDSGKTVLESIIYALRHLQHHTGEVCAYQKQFGHPQDQWV